ncbi:penicillin-binding protein 2 [Trichloromonas sp.]|uniref:penicillin-binding protein 2 n=1 Tax=Trichloromonas sp. TaxID=3069249 RepID=UPI003D8148D3
MSLNPSPEETPGLRRRFIVASLIIVGIFAVFALRLWFLQILNEEHYRNLSERNRIRYVAIDAPRGAIFDRHGSLLVDNRPAFTVSALRQEISDRQELFTKLSTLLDVDVSDLELRWKEGQGLPRYRPLPLLEDVGREAMEKVQENSVDLHGILVEVKPFRAYPHGDMAAHLFGYLGEITQHELQSEAFGSDYRSGDFVGKRGLEKLFERYLRGFEGERRVEVDVKGRELRILKTQDPKPGNKVFLTLKRDLQEAAETALGEEAGAVVVLDVKTGEVLVMVSRPSFNPAIFARGISGKEWIELLQNSRHPLQDKSIQGQYPPGSTFKIVTALAALKSGVASASTTVDCQGFMPLGNRDFRCWKKGGHGRTDLKKALKESCDVWFYKVSLDLGIDRIADMARSLGLGRSLGFPLEGEKSGLIPDRQWKKKRYGARWYDGETVIASIGQGYVLTTPLQLAVMTAAVANGGTVLRPQVVNRVEDLDGNVLEQMVPEVINEAKLSSADLQVVRRGIEAVVNEPGGTAWSSRLEAVKIAGKTGTSQVVKLKDKDDRTPKAEIAYRFRDHALFVGYAPADNPQIALAVVVEHGGSGSGAAAPVAKQIFARYFGAPLDKEAPISVDSVILPVAGDVPPDQQSPQGGAEGD